MLQNDVVGTTKAHLFGTWRKQKGWTPPHIQRGEGCYVLDASGRSVLDFSSMLVCVNLGYSNKAIVEAVTAQINSLPYVIPSMTTDIKAEVAKLVKEVLPAELEKFFFATSGTDAIEAAIKIARLKTGKPKILSRYFSYHGSTMGSIAASGEVRRWFVEHFGKAGDVVFAPPPYCYRCPLKLKYPDCGIACVEVIDHIIKNEFGIAGIIFEPVVGTNGVIVPPKGYMERLQEIARENGVLLLDDEVMTGWFRTGKWFAVEHWGVKPDILITAKGLTSSYMPLAMTAVNKEIAEHFEDNFFAHGHTYEAHPVALAAAKAAIQEYRRLRIWENVERVGKHLERRLRELEERHRSIGEVRGIGMFWAIDLTKDRRTGEPFNVYADKYAGNQIMAERLAAEALKRGVYLLGYINNLVVAPPLIATESDVDKGVEVLDEVLKISDEEAKA
ncbi:MAG: aminotransferase class III-fold pyridoxal phosphate-dependent enzyme [Thaumarchaeota archaeon]|nr:aminotransferase class III-fold pyridoxal phosphate-dependent enzyme [Candidatus Calditenuaceae archaeon]MDW8187382.1 aminotransferase class III-fold pyridoxal phosphate-dependent enzyme [Nitrososphaerota archaeon]